MNDKNSWIEFWIFPIILIILFFVSVFDLPYVFYTLLRVFVFIISLLFAFCCYCCDDKIAVVISAIIAIIWNPIMPVYLDKETWVILDVIALIIECCLAIYSYRLWKENK